MPKKLSIYMETTKKEPEQTIAEIQRLLRDINVRDMLINYDENGEVGAVSFTISKNGKLIPFRLPADHKPLLRLAERGMTRYIRDEDQARRVAWRQLYRWIQAQLALIQVGMVDTVEVFLPYMLINDKQTVYNKFLDGGFKKLLPEYKK